MKRALAGLIFVLFAASVWADPLPKGWILAGSRPQDYMSGADTEVVLQGARSGYLASRPGVDGAGFGTMMQTVSADQYRGSRVRFRASVKALNVTGWAGLWMRVDGKRLGMPLAFDNMQSRSIKGTSDWTTYDVVLDVPQGAVDVAFGILLDGKGQVWIDGASLQAVDPSVPTTGGAMPGSLPQEPQDLDFEGR